MTPDVVANFSTVQLEQQGKNRVSVTGRSGATRPPHYKVSVGRFDGFVAQRRELEFAAKTFSSVEINGTFYLLQRSSSFQRWASETPSDFVFAVKGGRFITHMKKLFSVETALANFFASGVLALGETWTVRMAAPTDDEIQRGRL